MPKKPGAGNCVHCGKYAHQRTWDHVFPKGWYPEDTPNDLEKWKIPTCSPCNAEYGRIEDDLGIVISLCLGPDAPNAKGMYKKALRALDPSIGRNFKDKLRRHQRKEKLLGAMLKGDQIPSDGTYPGLEERWSRPTCDQTALPVSAKNLERLVEKIVKGITYLEDGDFLNAEAEIEHLVVPARGAESIEGLLENHRETHSRGPGIDVVRAVTPEDGISALYKIIIWGEFVLYASVIRDLPQQGAAGDAPRAQRS